MDVKEEKHSSMHEDKWRDTKAMVKSKFTVLDEGKESIEEIPNATREFIEFTSPQGKMRLEYVVQPAVIDKKTTYSKLGGRAAKVEYVYSDTEMTRRMQAFRFDEGRGEWEEIKAGAM